MTNEQLPAINALCQHERENPRLKPEFVSLDDRNLLDIIQSCALLSQSLAFGQFLPERLAGQQALIDYINRIQRLVDGSALLRERPEMAANKLPQSVIKALTTELQSTDQITAVQPHMQLFLSFLQLLKQPQDQFKQLTAKHMHFYYQKVLKFQPQQAVPDSVYLTFELAQGVNSCVLAAGCQLTAPAAHEKQALEYVLDQSLAVNQARVTEVRHIAVGSQTVNIHDATKGQAVAPLYVLNQSTQESAETADETCYSMAVRYLMSPLLNLREGTRTITMTFGNEAAIDDFKANINCIKISTATAWQTLASRQLNGDGIPTDLAGGDNVTVDKSKIKSEFTITFKLNEFFPPVTALDIEGCIFTQPVIQFIPIAAGAFGFTDISLQVGVKGLKDLQLQNELRSFDNDATFDLFGFEPSQGASFYFVNAEICTKALDQLTINTQWVPGAVPNKADFPAIDDIYNYYPKPERITGEYIKTFKVNLIICGVNGQSIVQGKEQGLFTGLEFAGKVSKAFFQSIQFENQDYSFFDPIDWPVYYQLQLTAGDFLYPQYFIAQNQQAQIEAQINANQYLIGTNQQEIGLLGSRILVEENEELKRDLSSRIGELEADQTTLQGNNGDLEKQLGIVYPPYTPALRPLSIDYESTPLCCNLEYVNETGVLTSCQKLIEADATGSLILLKLTPVVAGQTITLLLKIEHLAKEGPQNGRQRYDMPTIKWTYEKKKTGEWIDIKPESTDINPLCDTYILSFIVPQHILSQDMLGDTLWLRAAIKSNDASSTTQLLYIQTQAVKATYVTPRQQAGQQPSLHLQTGLPAKRINSFVIQQPKIHQVHQPFSSFSGRQQQTGQQLGQTASERLGNRQRAITASDYETLVLAQFPQVKQVRCITATQLRNHPDLCQSQDRGQLKIQIIIHRPVNAADVIYPIAQQRLLNKIKDYLEKYSSEFAAITVENPVYLHLSAAMGAQFDSHHDPVQQFNEDVTALLAEQLLDEHNQPVMGKRPDFNKLRRSLMQKSYIKQITKLSLPPCDANGLIAKHDILAVYVPAIKHQISDTRVEEITE